MKTMRSALHWAMAMAATLSLGSCVQEQTAGDPLAEASALDSPEITATIAAGETRTCVDADLNVLWEAGDEITTFLKTKENRHYAYAGEGGEASGKFDAVEGVSHHYFDAVAYNYGVYPYDAEAKIDKEGTVTVTVPAVQPYKEDSFAPGMNVMTAASEDRTLAFKNVCGYLTVKLYGEGVKVNGIMLRGNAGEALAGAGTVKVSPTEAPVLTLGGEAATEIKLEADEAVALGATAEKATEFWFVVAPGLLSQGITVVVTGEDGEVLLEQATQKEVEIVRSEVYRMAAVEVKAEEPEPEPEIAGHVYVEMGDGLKWATMNVGATKPEEYGDYFAWGETEPKEDYSWATYKHVIEGGTEWKDINKYTIDDGQTDGYWYMLQVDKETGDSKYVFWGDKKTQLEAADEAASANWGATWRMPTDAEWTALRDEANFKWDWTDDYEGTGVAGRIVTSKVSGYEGNTIFLPAAGYRYGTSLYNAGSLGYYWSSSLSESYSDKARYVLFDSSYVYRHLSSRCYGLSVRPVSE